MWNPREGFNLLIASSCPLDVMAAVESVEYFTDVLLSARVPVGVSDVAFGCFRIQNLTMLVQSYQPFNVIIDGVLAVTFFL